ncbi:MULTISPECIES: peptidase inhibitor family I36 protein [Streptomyces]|jgi:hypothetical protein|uniref:peptidase inhibitor family I36 protein n=1 Tax=Streptomyces TaxID=1883 RepID=UPI0016774C0D|nr:peptidase inhibitor family I36 protein [Streptomyces umbrinus]MCR3730141.1 hypothetical protein [Streptomyces umbrinus]MCX4558507.1 peptidase inhibitor family I36 protein [Streptomyces phaeochromogenes]GHB85338.1 hypothetical protein GCM10010306_095070 [Streptomyces umbrinus]GHH58959.1 hypothetical protein GCM10018775_69700 [Streptomyces umbrinus]
MMKSRLGVLAMTGAATVAMMGLSTGTAQAGIAGYNLCAQATGSVYNSLCLYYNSNQEGSFAAFTRNVADLDPWIFGHIGTPNSAGQGQGVKNNAASAANPGSNCWRVYFNSNYAGASDYIGDSGYRQLVSTYNENASVKAC